MPEWSPAQLETFASLAELVARRVMLAPGETARQRESRCNDTTLSD